VPPVGVQGGKDFHKMYIIILLLAVVLTFVITMFGMIALIDKIDYPDYTKYFKETIVNMLQRVDQDLIELRNKILTGEERDKNIYAQNRIESIYNDLLYIAYTGFFKKTKNKEEK